MKIIFGHFYTSFLCFLHCILRLFRLEGPQTGDVKTMTRSSPSVATMDLLSKLKEQGYEITSRSIENWIDFGFINKPVRKSLGRGRGITSQYPLEIVEQCIAISKVTRRGLPWQESALMLFVQGYEFPDQEIVRKAYLYFFNKIISSLKIGAGEDELDVAEKMVVKVKDKHKPFVSSIKKNFSNSPSIVDPATNKPISPQESAKSMLINTMLPTLGQPLSTDTMTEIIYGLGVSLEELSDREKETYLEDLCKVSQYMDTKEVIQIIKEVPLSSLYLFIKFLKDNIIEKVNILLPSNTNLILAQQGLIIYYIASKLRAEKESKI